LKIDARLWIEHVAEVSQFLSLLPLTISPKVVGTQACERHQEQWNRHLQHHGQHIFSGARRMLQRLNEHLPWQLTVQRNHQPHDEPTPDIQRDSYFTADHFYCVETMCAPCGVVISWAKFAKSESPANILKFLKSVYQQKSQGQTIFVLMKHVWCFTQL
jgi:hypothetical protein